jgi:hypothetical protein
MANRIVAGLAAGAAGTLALNVAGYMDMLVRARPASKLPTRVAARLADEFGLPLYDEENRHEAVGALLGYSNGLGIGVAYGILRLVLPRPPAWLAGAALGSLAMAASDYPATRLGLTDPRQWSGADWMADVVPHMAYGVVTALTFEAIKK